MLARTDYLNNNKELAFLGLNESTLLEILETRLSQTPIPRKPAQNETCY